MRWVDAVAAEFSKYVTWPLASLKLDDLFAAYLAREERDACQLGYAVEVTPGGDVTAVHVTSAPASAGVLGGPATCSAPLLLPGGATVVEVARGGAAVLPITGLRWANAAGAPAAPNA